jgi:hypothetical protein
MKLAGALRQKAREGKLGGGGAMGDYEAVSVLVLKMAVAQSGMR